MESKQFKDIVAIKWPGQVPLAFHSRNLEVAEISSEAWNALNAPTPIAKEVLEELNLWNEQHNSSVKSGTLAPVIKNFSINVTQICNLKCSYCAAGGDGTYGSAQSKINIEKTLPQLNFFLSKLPAGSEFRITFLGGEPLLYPEGIELIADYVTGFASQNQLKARFSLVTNGTLITDSILTLFKKIKPKVTISIDGASTRNDKSRPLRNGQGSTPLIIDGIKKVCSIKENLERPLTLHGVFNEQNLDLLGAYKFYQQFPVDSFEFTSSVTNQGLDLNNNFILAYQDIAEAAFLLGGEPELRRINLFDHYFEALDQHQQKENFCGAGKSFLMIDAQNNLYTCPWDVNSTKEKVGTGTTLFEEKIKDYQKPLIEINSCQSCWARYLCGGGCMFIHKNASGSKHTKDPLFCQRTRALIGIALLYYKQCRNSCEEGLHEAH